MCSSDLGDIKLNGIKQQLKRAPNYSSSGGELGAEVAAANKPWLSIEVDFGTDIEWADDVQIKYFVLMGEGREAKMFVGEASHINVAKGAHHYSAMFMHPSAIQRYGRGKVEAVAVQLYYQGRLMDQESEPKSRARWWEQFSPTTGYLLKPNDTPWALKAFDRFEAYKSTP